MAVLPVIVGFGGMNAAGRSSGFHSYKRMICDVLSEKEMHRTWLDLACRMQLVAPGEHSPGEHSIDKLINKIKARTLVRRIEAFDPQQVPTHIKGHASHPTTLTIKKSKCPHPLPTNWIAEPIDDHWVQLHLPAQTDLLLATSKALSVSSAGSLPSGFNPNALYHSHHHPRGLALSVYGASDALHMLGMDWGTVLSHVAPDQISVYAGSALSQVDEYSYVGLIAEPLRGQRVSSKMMPMSLAEMPADFINSYVINSVGQTGTQVGACASFLYNLKQGALDIQSGRAKVVIVGNAEAPIVPEIIEGFSAMSALATDESLCLLDNAKQPDYRRACRPFSTNTGFTIAEGAQFVILMEDALAIKLGATIYGSVADVFVNADGNKKSIAKPGVGNYVTFAKATALAKAMLGQTGLQQTVVLAHGTGTPQNRITESHILNEVAHTFGIHDWPVTAIKAYLGHTISVAAGDQLLCALGMWQYGYLPGIKTIDHIADDVHHDHLNILRDHHDVGKNCKAALLNSKGFGGNNATGLIISPDETQRILINKFGRDGLSTYRKQNEKTALAVEQYDQRASEGQETIYYAFGTHVMEAEDVTMTTTSMKLSQFETEITLPTTNPYG